MLGQPVKANCRTCLSLVVVDKNKPGHVLSHNKPLEKKQRFKDAVKCPGTRALKSDQDRQFSKFDPVFRPYGYTQ